ncbi:MAG: hypothetical protein KC643_17055, partial [Nitrospira sp.]|nr:hypothetical protein [Nitrospira sp.]
YQVAWNWFVIGTQNASPIPRESVFIIEITNYLFGVSGNSHNIPLENHLKVRPQQPQPKEGNRFFKRLGATHVVPAGYSLNIFGKRSCNG